MWAVQGQERAALGRAAMQVGGTFSRYERYLVKVLTAMTAQVSWSFRAAARYVF